MLPRLILAAVAMALAGTAVAAPPGEDSCAIEVRNVDFGLYDPTSPSPNDTSGAVLMRCDCEGPGCGAIHYRLELQGDQGLTRPGRGGDLRYDLYADPARTLRAGEGDAAISGIYQPSHFGEPLEIPLYGRMPPLQPAAPGVYGGLLTLVVTY